MMSEEMAYAGITPCGCMVAVTIDSTEHKKQVAKEIADWVSDGLTIKRVTVIEARENLKRCTHKQPAEASHE